MKKIVFTSTVLLLSLHSFSQQKAVKGKNDLYQGFRSPSNAARPRVWWHWMNGNISKEGIRKDLLWMHRIGIGGFQNFDANMTTPQVVNSRLTYMTPEWKDAFQFTTKLADSLNLEMAIAGSPGWSESGGPWVPAKDGMKKLVWSEVRIKGGQTVNSKLPKPPGNTGVFQNLPLVPGFDAPPKAPPSYYADIAVLAYRLPATHVSMVELSPKVTSSGGSFAIAQLTDNDLETTNLLPRDSAKEYAWIQYEFVQPQTIKAITIVGGGDKGPFGLFGDKPENRSLEVSDDGVAFRRITFLPLGSIPQHTLVIPATTAKFFRVTFKNPVPPPTLGTFMGGSGDAVPPAGTNVAEVVLHPHAVIDCFEEKAGFSVVISRKTESKAEAEDAINLSDVVDLTGKMNDEPI